MDRQYTDSARHSHVARLRKMVPRAPRAELHLERGARGRAVSREQRPRRADDRYDRGSVNHSSGFAKFDGVNFVHNSASVNVAARCGCRSEVRAACVSVQKRSAAVEDTLGVTMIVFFLLDRPAQPAVKPAVQPTMHPVVQPVAQPAQGSVLPNKLCSQWCRLLCSQPFCNSPVRARPNEFWTVPVLCSDYRSTYE